MFHPRFTGLPTFRTLSPFDEVSRMRRQMDRIMDTLLQRPAATTGSGVFPAINLTEDDNSFYLRAELPGVSSADLEVQATGRNLTLSGERRPMAVDASARYHRRERETGRFSRAFALPKEIDPERVEARLSDGILTLRVPKAASEKPRRIQISG